jgi:hypothetical protein
MLYPIASPSVGNYLPPVMDEELSTPAMRAARYRQEAKELRAFAERSASPALQRQLLELAERYDRLAERAEKGHP